MTLVPAIAGGSQIRALFAIGAVVLAVTVLLSCAAAPEHRWSSPHSMRHKEQPGLRLAFSRTMGALLAMSAAMKRLAVVQFFSWMSMFLFLIYNSSWMAQGVFGGVPNGGGAAGARYEQGVRAAAFAMCLHSLAGMAVSPLLPRLIDTVGSSAVYCASHVYFAALLTCASLVSSPAAAYALVAACGAHFSVIVTVPFHLCASQTVATDGALTLGVMNVFVVLPQLVVTVAGGPVLHLVNYDFSRVLAVAASFALAAAACIFKLKLT